MTRVLRHGALRITLPLLIVAVWALLTADGNSVYFPPVGEIASSFRELWLFDRVPTDVLPSIRNLLAGYAMAMIIGIVLGVGLSLSETVSDAAEPAISFLRALPPVVIVPIALALLGIGSSMHIAVIVFGATWVVLLNTLDGIRSIDPVTRHVLACYRIGHRVRLTKVLLQGALPQVLAGAKVALQVSFILMVVGEMIGATEGLGFLVLQSQRTYDITAMWAGMVVLGLIGYALNWLSDLAANRLLRSHGIARDKTNL